MKCQVTLSGNNIFTLNILTDMADRANPADPDQMLKIAAYDQDLHSLPLIKQYLDTIMGSKMDIHFFFFLLIWVFTAL